MAKGIVKYRTGEDLEPIAQAITSMGQLASKEDKTIGLAEKVKKISTDATAIPQMVMSGASFYSEGSKQIGTMPNHGAVYQKLTTGETYIVPKGYHDGHGRVSAADLLSQTQATATATQVLFGQTAYVNGQKITGTMPNRGANNIVLPVNGTATIPEGYHNGQGRVTQNIPVKVAQNFLPGTTNQTIQAGQYLSGHQTILGDPNLISNNIVKGKTIFGVTGNFIQPEPTVYYVQNGTPIQSLGNYRGIGSIPYILPEYGLDAEKIGYIRVMQQGQPANFLTFLNPIDVSLHKALTILNSTGIGFEFTYSLFGLISHEALLYATVENLSNRVINYRYGWTAVSDHSIYNKQQNTIDITNLSGTYYLVIGFRSCNDGYNKFWYIRNIYLSY